MLNELHPGLAVTVGAYEKLTETVGVDSTLTIFREQVKAVKKETKIEANNQSLYRGTLVHSLYRLSLVMAATKQSELLSLLRQ